jgi:phosphoadenosine phosphosulfate reductase
MHSLDEIRKKTDSLNIQEFLNFFLHTYRNQIALATSFGAEDQVLTDILVKIDPSVTVFTLDTGRLPNETYECMQKTIEKYKIKIQALFPDREDVEKMILESGPNLFYQSVENRKLCCRIRKVDPLKRYLASLNFWICGLRREQSITRETISRVEWDEGNGLIKLNPLADWTRDQVWNYIKENNVPYNTLHDKGYASVGCAPCTRAILAGEHERAGRWWWENPDTKECGLHLKDGKMLRSTPQK